MSAKRLRGPGRELKTDPSNKLMLGMSVRATLEKIMSYKRPCIVHVWTEAVTLQNKSENSTRTTKIFQLLTVNTLKLTYGPQKKLFSPPENTKGLKCKSHV